MPTSPCAPAAPRSSRSTSGTSARPTSSTPPRASSAASGSGRRSSPPPRCAPAKRGRRLRLYYAAQIGRRPPRFAIQVNDRRLISRDWAFHLENRLREAYSLEGVPIVIDFVPRKSRYKDAA